MNPVRNPFSLTIPLEATYQGRKVGILAFGDREGSSPVVLLLDNLTATWVSVGDCTGYRPVTVDRLTQIIDENARIAR